MAARSGIVLRRCHLHWNNSGHVTDQMQIVSIARLDLVDVRDVL